MGPMPPEAKRALSIQSVKLGRSWESLASRTKFIFPIVQGQRAPTIKGHVVLKAGVCREVGLSWELGSGNQAPT